MKYTGRETPLFFPQGPLSRARVRVYLLEVTKIFLIILISSDVKIIKPIYFGLTNLF